jgi:hypothetical protein
MNSVLLYLGAVVIGAWGIAHIAALRPVVAGFGALTPDNRRILVMEWTDEGLTMVFVGLLVAVVTPTLGAESPAAILVYRLSAGMLLALALVSTLTGARTSVLPMRLCPVVKSAVAGLFIAGSLL